MSRPIELPGLIGLLGDMATGLAPLADICGGCNVSTLRRWANSPEKIPTRKFLFLKRLESKMPPQDIFTEGETSWIITTRGGRIIFDTADIDIVCIYRWRATPYTYATATGADKRNTFMHRLIVGDPGPGNVVDHINQNKLDNRRANLAIVTVGTNNYNVRSERAHGYRGVTFNKRSKHKPWSACISKNKVRYNLGYFTSAEDAAIAYNTKAVELYGEYAEINIVR